MNHAKSRDAKLLPSREGIRLKNLKKRMESPEGYTPLHSHPGVLAVRPRSQGTGVTACLANRTAIGISPAQESLSKVVRRLLCLEFESDGTREKSTHNHEDKQIERCVSLHRVFKSIRLACV